MFQKWYRAAQRHWMFGIERRLSFTYRKSSTCCNTQHQIWTLYLPFLLRDLDLLIKGLDRKPNSSCLNAVQTLTAEVDVAKGVSTPSDDDDATCRPEMSVRATPRESGRKVRGRPAGVRSAGKRARRHSHTPATCCRRRRRCCWCDLTSWHELFSSSMWLLLLLLLLQHPGNDYYYIARKSVTVPTNS